MKIAILTQYYPPEIGAPQARLSDLARRLQERGHQVTVLTAMPNYPRGRIYAGYGGFFQRETLDGVAVIRTFIYATQSAGMVRRLLNYFSFVLSSLVVGLLTLPRVDYLLTESPPLFLGISGFVLSRAKGARWIFNVSDLWPETAVLLGVVREGLALRIAFALESFCYRKAWLVSTQTRGMQEDIRRRFPAVRTYHLSNGVDLSLFSPDRRSQRLREMLLGGEDGPGSCVAIYAGLHGLAQGLDQILDAAKQVENQSNLAFVFVGDGPERQALIERSRTMGLRRVRFLDAIARSEIPALLASADIAVVPLKLALPGAAPSKLYEAMGTALPILLIAGGEAAEIVRRANAGVVVAYGDTRSMADALRLLASDPAKRRELGESGRRSAEERFDRRAITAAFASFLEGGGAPPSRPPQSAD
jgi:glycosyltransferase involved in cell wall biosynthesis